MANCFVTGGTGFVGSHILNLLCDKHHSVFSLARETSVLGFLPQGVMTVRGDVTDLDALTNAVPKDTEWFFHNAGVMADWGGKTHFYPVNVEGTHNVLETVRRKDIPRLIHTSSTGVYGFPDSSQPLDEEAPKRPEGFYQKSKYEGEKLIEQYSKDYGIKATVVRPPTVLGPHDMFTAPQIVDRVAKGSMVYFGDGTNLISFAHAEDVAACQVAAAERFDKSAGNAYNVISFTCQFKELLQTIESQLNPPATGRLRRVPYRAALTLGTLMGGTYSAFRSKKAPLLTSFRVKLFGTTYIIDDSKARRELGYTPKHNLESTVKSMLTRVESFKPR